MPSADAVIRDLEIMAGAVHYRKWIYSQFSPYLGQRIIEVGAGIGNFTGLFLDRELVVVLDSYLPCIEYLKQKFIHNHNVVPVQMDISDPAITELDRYAPDTIVCINVLEHVQDDGAALSNMFKILTRGGTLALLVPALPFLYGSIDRLVGHQRRYRKRELTEKLTRAGFSVSSIYFMNSIAVPGWFLTGRILKQREESPRQVWFYDSVVVPVLRRMERFIRPPFGLSLIVIARKESGSE
jgi:SAM-dependent methyltransferase